MDTSGGAQRYLETNLGELGAVGRTCLGWAEVAPARIQKVANGLEALRERLSPSAGIARHVGLAGKTKCARGGIGTLLAMELFAGASKRVE